MKTAGKIYLLLCTLIAVYLLVSCSNQDDMIENPIITIDNDENTYIYNGIAISGCVASSSKLVTVIFSYIRNGSAETFKIITAFDNNNEYTFNEVLLNVTNNVTGIKVSATNTDGRSAELILPVISYTPLSQTRAEWVR